MLGLPVVPFEEIETAFPPEHYQMFVAIGYRNLNAARAGKYRQAKAKGYALASYVSTRSLLWPDLKLGDNCLILEGNTIQPFVTIGSNVIIWCGNLISHHVHIGDNAFIASHVVVSGGVKIGRSCFIGVNATLREHLSIADNTIVGAGALILKNTEENAGYLESATGKVGVPSHRLQALL